jgi:nitroimidazol reductase NimA-like FMN-containing flavoprotein (pyridoxamine 5'-phosphate oxidase superfamily)
MRRKDREVVEFNEIIKIVDKCEVIHLAMVDNGIPYIVPLNFGYEIKDNTLVMYFHSALQGRKIEILKANPFICFEMDCSFRALQNEVPCNWSAEFESVIGYGRVSLIENANERKTALDSILKKYGFKGVPEYQQNDLRLTAIYKIAVDRMTGKRNIK